MLYLKMDVRDVLPHRNTGGPVDNFDADGCLALGLQHIVHQVLCREIDVAAPVWIVLAEYALGVETTQAPATGGQS